FPEMKKDIDLYKGKLYVLGGLIVSTKFTEEDSVIEAAYISVDKNGNLKKTKPSNVRFLATLAKEKGILDPVLYKRGSEITVAGEFTGTKTEEIEKMNYTYPVFDIKEVYLWEEKAEVEGYYGMPAYAYPYYPYMWDRWGPWGPWWGPPVFIVPRGKKNK
ncbi:MAG TPA: Slp family lipoprotein, partial [Candidatus Brocadiales bacterium]|nr:Slp family lipoprotein [Candidatus Brocadiales bacterium]